MGKFTAQLLKHCRFAAITEESSYTGGMQDEQRIN